MPLFTGEDAILKKREGKWEIRQKGGKQYKLAGCQAQANLFKKTLLASVGHLLSSHVQSLPLRAAHCGRKRARS
jgi:hypothetical protein